jgi:hypothetical protein
MDTCKMWWWGGEARVKARGRRACEAVAASVGGKGRGAAVGGERAATGAGSGGARWDGGIEWRCGRWMTWHFRN